MNLLHRTDDAGEALTFMGALRASPPNEGFQAISTHSQRRNIAINIRFWKGNEIKCYGL
jgi:hypothetical protein